LPFKAFYPITPRITVKNGLKGASIPFGGHFLAQSANGLIQCVYFIHFIDCPSPFLPMPSKHRVSVAINAKGNASVLQTLLVVVGFAW
jgi:hypothetical protein